MNNIFYLFAFGLIFYASFMDISVRKIPDSINILLLINWIICFIYNSFIQGKILTQFLNGFCLCFVVSVGIFIISSSYKKITGLKAFGGGDIKLIFSSGLLLLPNEYIKMLFVAFLISFAYGILTRKLFKGIPFAPGILGGYVWILINILIK